MIIRMQCNDNAMHYHVLEPFMVMFVMRPIIYGVLRRAGMIFTMGKRTVSSSPVKLANVFAQQDIFNAKSLSTLLLRVLKRLKIIKSIHCRL